MPLQLQKMCTPCVSGRCACVFFKRCHTALQPSATSAVPVMPFENTDSASHCHTTFIVAAELQSGATERTLQSVTGSVFTSCWQAAFVMNSAASGRA